MALPPAGPSESIDHMVRPPPGGSEDEPLENKSNEQKEEEALQINPYSLTLYHMN